MWEEGRGGTEDWTRDWDSGPSGGPGPVSRHQRGLTGEMRCDVIRPSLTPARHNPMKCCKYRLFCEERSCFDEHEILEFFSQNKVSLKAF